MLLMMSGFCFPGCVGIQTKLIWNENEFKVIRNQSKIFVYMNHTQGTKYKCIRGSNLPVTLLCLFSITSSFLSFRWWCLWWLFFGLCLCLVEYFLWFLRTCANTLVGPPAPPNSFIGATVTKIPCEGKFSRFVNWTMEYRFRAAKSCFIAFDVFPGSSTSTHSVPIPLIFLSLSNHEMESAPKPKMR